MLNPVDDSIYKHIWPIIDGIIIGLLGGLVNGLRKKSFTSYSQTVAVLLTAGFSGMLAQLICGWLGTDLRLQFAMSGIAGYSGGVILDDVLLRVRSVIKEGMKTKDGSQDMTTKDPTCD